MPLTDSYGQNVQYPTLTDKPNAQSLSEGLVTGIVPKVVMQFASATVRGATITKPVAGMVTWLKDVKRLEVYDGSGSNVLNFNQLPVEARPSSLRTLVVPCSDVNSARITLKMDVTTDGWLKLVGIQSDTNPPWVGFNGVFCSL